MGNYKYNTKNDLLFKTYTYFKRINNKNEHRQR